MFENLQEFISNNQDDIIITGGISKEKVHVLEEILGLKFRSEASRRAGILGGFEK